MLSHTEPSLHYDRRLRSTTGQHVRQVGQERQPFFFALFAVRCASSIQYKRRFETTRSPNSEEGTKRKQGSMSLRLPKRRMGGFFFLVRRWLMWTAREHLAVPRWLGHVDGLLGLGAGDVGMSVALSAIPHTTAADGAGCAARARSPPPPSSARSQTKKKKEKTHKEASKRPTVAAKTIQVAWCSSAWPPTSLSLCRAAMKRPRSMPRATAETTKEKKAHKLPRRPLHAPPWEGTTQCLKLSPASKNEI